MRYKFYAFIICFWLLQAMSAQGQPHQYSLGVPVLDTVATFFIMSQDSCAPNYNVDFSAEIFDVTGVELYLIIDTINAAVGSVSTYPGSVLNLGDTLPVPSADSVSGSYKFFFAGGAGDNLIIRLIAEGVPTVLGESYPCDSLTVVGLPVTCQGGVLASFSVNCMVACGPPPVAGFKNKITASGSGYLVDFIDTSSYASTWLWDFDDGSTATTQNTSHVYADSGVYNVCLTITHPCGTDSVCTGVTAYCVAPQANFDTLISGAAVNFIDISSDATSWIWDFGDGNQSTLQHPSNSYVANGTYTVCLIVSNTCGLDTVCVDVVINCLFPVAAYTTDTVDTNIYTVVFTDQSSTGLFWSWDFGGGAVSMEESPVYTFPNLTVSANYEVCLAVTNVCGVDSVCQNVFIPAPVGVYDHGSEAIQTIRVNPNPFMNFSSIELPQNHAVGNYTFAMCNAIGENVLIPNTIQDKKIVLHAEHLDSGIYIFRIMFEDGVSYQGRAVIIR